MSFICFILLYFITFFGAKKQRVNFFFFLRREWLSIDMGLNFKDFGCDKNFVVQIFFFLVLISRLCYMLKKKLW